MAIDCGLGVINIASDRCLVISLCVHEFLFQDGHILRSVRVEGVLSHSRLPLEENMSTSSWLLCRCFHARPLSPASWHKLRANVVFRNG